MHWQHMWSISWNWVFNWWGMAGWDRWKEVNGEYETNKLGYEALQNKSNNPWAYVSYEMWTRWYSYYMCFKYMGVTFGWWGTPDARWYSNLFYYANTNMKSEATNKF